MYLFSSSCDCAGDNTITAEEELTDEPIQNQNKRIVRILVNSNKGFNSASVNIMQSSFSSFIRIWAEFAEQRDCLSINTEQYNRNWKSQSSSSSVPPSKRNQQQQQKHSNSHCGWNGKNANITRIWSDPKFVLSFANESISDILLWSFSSSPYPSIVKVAFRKPNNNDP